MTIRRMAENMVTSFTHNLWKPILDSSYLVKIIPTFRLVLALKDIPFHPTSILRLQPPCNEFDIHHFCPEDIDLLFLGTNTFKRLRDRRRKRWLGKVNIRRRTRHILVI
jgi:hypothetical protein